MPSHRAPATARDAVRSSNQNAVLQAVHRYGPISRKAVAERLRLSPAAITSITSDLIDRGLVFEAREADRGGVGRRAILLEVNYDLAYVAGIKLSNSAITSAATKLDAVPLETLHALIADTSPTHVIKAVVKEFQALEAGLDKPIQTLGLNLPGIVDLDQRTVRYSPLLGWAQVPLGHLLEDELGIPVLVENDVNALALAEAWFGHGRDHDSFLVVTLGRGVGLGIVLAGDVYRGPSGGAGEFGHVLLDPDGPATQHAKPGTLEAYLSDDGLLREARARLTAFSPDDSSERLVELAQAGDPEALATYRDAGAVLGRALSMLIDIFAPTLIVLSGEGMRASTFIVPAARESMFEHSFGDLGDRVELVVAPWGDDTWARGAAGLAASRFLVDAAMDTHPGR